MQNNLSQNQKNIPGPFGNDADNVAQKKDENNKYENVSYHTMKDDLTSVEKNQDPSQAAEKSFSASQNIPSSSLKSAISKEKNYDDNDNANPLLFKKKFAHLKESPPTNFPTMENNKLSFSKPKKTSSSEKQINYGAEIRKDEINSEKSQRNAISWRPFVARMAVFLIIIFLLSGGYFWWSNFQKDPNRSNDLPTEENLVQSEKIPAVTEISYSWENPNYLSLDIETSDSGKIMAKLQEIAEEIKEIPEEDKLFEFIVTDANNNPVAFPIFAYISGINLSQDLFTGLEEEFSLYFYKNAGEIRLGLQTKIQDPKIVTEKIKQEEISIVKTLEPLFLGNSVRQENIIMEDSHYKDYEIRYVNLNEKNSISVDYMITNDILIIGTSKETIRIIIDRVMREKILESKESTKTNEEINLNEVLEGLN